MSTCINTQLEPLFIPPPPPPPIMATTKNVSFSSRRTWQGRGTWRKRLHCGLCEALRHGCPHLPAGPSPVGGEGARSSKAGQHCIPQRRALLLRETAAGKESVRGLSSGKLQWDIHGLLCMLSLVSPLLP